MENLAEKIISHLLGNPYQMIRKGNYLKQGTCPECHKKELATSIENPFILKCYPEYGGCGTSIRAFDYIKELRQNFSENFPATKDEPLNTANSYLQHVCGFDLEKIKDWYAQGSFCKSNADRSTETVRFFLENEQIKWVDYFVDPVVLSYKDTGKYETITVDCVRTWDGIWWQPPTLIIREKTELYVTSSILDAIALNLSNIPTVAAFLQDEMPLNSIKQHLGKNIVWVLAFGSDKASLELARKYTIFLKECGEKTKTLYCGEENSAVNWVTLYKKKQLTEKHMTRYEYLGGQLTADSKERKAFYTFMLSDEKRRHFVIDSHNETYSCIVNMETYEENSGCIDNRKDAILKTKLAAFRSAAAISKICSFRIEYLYHQQPENGNPGRYVMRFHFANKAPSRDLAFSHTAFSSSTRFKEAALEVPGGMFKGETKDITYLYETWTHNFKKTVRTLDFVGYDKASKAYLFNDLAITKGQVLAINKEGFFNLPSGEGIKCQIDNGQRISQKEPVNFFPDFETAYGMTGLVALTWFLGSLFAEQIRELQSSYPYFELIGDAGSGKSHLVDTLTKLIGRDANVFDPLKSSQAARMRRFADTSNQPIICNESENEEDGKRGHFGKISWNDLKDLYEGVIGRSMGVKTNDNQTKTPRFRGALMILQNIQVQASEAFMTRIFFSRLDRSHHTTQGREADMRLMALKSEQLSGWFVNVLRQEQPLLKHFAMSYNHHNARLQTAGTLKLQRVIHNYSQMLALTDCLPMVVPISSEKLKHLKVKIEQLAHERETMLRRDHPMVIQFWEAYQFLNTMPIKTEEGYEYEEPLNHSSNPDEIAIQLNDFRKKCVQHAQEVLDERELKKYLVTSTIPKFIDSNVSMYSRHTKKSVRVWVFKKPGKS